MGIKEVLNNIESVKDYKERLKIEYYQTAIRATKLKTMLIKWDNSELFFNPTCPRELYDEQLYAMNAYLDVLEARAKLEHIELDVVDK